MNFKPSDFFINVIEFFGILIPGVLLYLLHGDLLLELGFSVDISGDLHWILFFCVSYILGQFLLGFSVWMNNISIKRLHGITIGYYKKVKDLGTLPVTKTSNKVSMERDETTYFYSAFSFLRLNNSSALQEIERQAAEYKLFRSLSLLFMLDVLFVGADLMFNISSEKTYSVWRLPFSVIIGFLSFRRFDFLFDWCYRLVFEYYLLLQNGKRVEQDKER